MKIPDRFVAARIGAIIAGILLVAETNHAQSQDAFAIGGDVSFLLRIEQHGGVYTDDAIPRQALSIFRDHGFNTMRLRLWHAPPDGYSGLDTTLALARRLKALGYDFLLDIHYSDSWADPGKQTKPRAWTGLPFSVLVDSVYRYSRNVVAALSKAGAQPDVVQIGNEITNGMLWPEGRVNGEYDTPEQWQQFATLLKAGIRGVREATQPQPVPVMLHIDRGADYPASAWFFDHILAEDVDFEIIGLSYYPFWHGGMDRLQYNLDSLGQRYNRDIVVVETAYPWTLWNFDTTPNLVGELDEVFAGYAPSPAGQEQFLAELKAVVAGVADDRGRGIVYWEPEYIVSPGFGSVWENMALFDETGESLQAIDALANGGPPRRHYAFVTLPLNVASIPDTLDAAAAFDIRGAVEGRNPWVLSDGSYLDWSAGSNLRLSQRAGDVFAITFAAPVGKELRFKFWSQAAERLGLNFGWDVGETNTDAQGNTYFRVEGDTTLPLHFFNTGPVRKPYAWKPWAEKADTVAVWFRVYMHTRAARQQGYAPDAPVPVGVRGDNLHGRGPLAPNGSRVVLQRESGQVKQPGYTLFSGVAYYPASLSGLQQAYAFCWGDSACEESFLPGKRHFRIPGQDSTLHWVFYGDSPPVDDSPVAVAPVQKTVPATLVLEGNSPNPVVGSTTVRFQLAKATAVRLVLYDVLGREVKVIEKQWLPAGANRLVVDFRALPSGLYFYRLQAGGEEVAGKLLRVR